MAILDWIYPKKCLGCGAWGRYICGDCQQGVRRKGSSLEYQGVVRRAIKEIKYRGTYDMVSEIVSLWNPVRPQGELVVTSVPMWGGKKWRRGYNQAELIAKEVARLWRAQYVEVLRRARETKPMYGLSKSERAANVRGAFLFNPKFEITNTKQTQNSKLDVRNKILVLVDDVWTSGATLSECQRMLKKCGFGRIIPLSLAS